MDLKTDDQVGKLQSKIKRRNLGLCAFVAIVGTLGIISLSTISSHPIIGVVCVALCAIAIMMVIFFGYSKRIRPVEIEIFELQQQVNGMNL